MCLSKLGCGCHPDGSIGIDCSDAGQCQCKEDIEGEKCDHCKSTFFGFPSCQPCLCDDKGSVNSTTCTPDDGKCTCREKYAGIKCDQCHDGYHKDASGKCIQGTIHIFGTIGLLLIHVFQVTQRFSWSLESPGWMERYLKS